VSAIRISAVVIATVVLVGCGASPASTSSSGSQLPGSTAGPVADVDLQLRPVLSEAPTASCTLPRVAAPPAKSPVEACSADGTLRYTLGPAAVTGNQVASISVAKSAVVGSPEIDITLDAKGSAALAAITGQLAGNDPTRSQLAVYVHGQVQSSPSVSQSIQGGSVVITGDFTTAQAQAIVDGLVQH